MATLSLTRREEFRKRFRRSGSLGLPFVPESDIPVLREWVEGPVVEELKEDGDVTRKVSGTGNRCLTMVRLRFSSVLDVRRNEAGTKGRVQDIVNRGCAIYISNDQDF